MRRPSPELDFSAQQGRVKSSTAAEHIRNHPDNVASATQSLLMRAEKCIATGGGHFEQLL